VQRALACVVEDLIDFVSLMSATAAS
jgi:hypothetical protein